MKLDRKIVVTKDIVGKTIRDLVVLEDKLWILFNDDHVAVLDQAFKMGDNLSSMYRYYGYLTEEKLASVVCCGPRCSNAITDRKFSYETVYCCTACADAAEREVKRQALEAELAKIKERLGEE